MSALLQTIRHISIKRLLPIIALVSIAASSSISVLAQEVWQIDPRHSFAVLSLGSGTNVVQIGLARVSGEVVFDATDSDDPTVSFETVSEGGTQADYAKMKFKSKRCDRANGKLVVTGDLAVTRIERTVTAEPNEAYAGQQYGDPMAHTVSREITLVFANPGKPVFQNAAMQLSGSGSVVREDFPQLLNAITLDNWQSELINDEQCVNPTTIGDDYHGPNCTGTVIADLNNPVAPAGVGEDFFGFKPAATPDPNRATISVDLQLFQSSSSAQLAK